MHRLAQTVLTYVRSLELLQPGDRVGIAVSGGADSVALLRVALEIRSEIGIVVSVLHLNHQLRGEESDKDEAFVRSVADAHGLEFIGQNQDVGGHSEQQKLSIEAAARQLRHEFFRSPLLAGKVNKVATAHTMDDQAETVLLRLMRGTGGRGIAAIRPRLRIQDQNVEAEKGRDRGRIVRPLLPLRRHQVREYLHDIAQAWREDSSNLDPRYTRNRVRSMLLPLMEREFNPSVVSRLAGFAEIAQAEEIFWEAECRRISERMVKTGPGGQFSVDGSLFRTHPLAVQRRLLQSFERFGVSLGFEHIEEVIRQADRETIPAELALPSDWTVRFAGNELRFIPPDFPIVKSSQDYSYDLPVPGSVVVPEAGVVIETTVATGGCLRLADRKLLAAGLRIRNWRSGERFWPAHYKAPRKIKELLQGRRIHGESKRAWPVVASGEEIIWVRGLGIRRDLLVSGDPGLSISDRPLAAGL
jgi:tRNA(Ile)-lysidine synthase